MNVVRVRPPPWFWVVAILLLLWEAVGVAACVMQIRMGAASWPAGMGYDRRLYLEMPPWYNGVYALATFSGLLAALLLILRQAAAGALFWASLVAIVVMFGYVFAATDVITHKGFMAAAGFPIVIAAIGVVAVWVAGVARRRGWIG